MTTIKKKPHSSAANSLDVVVVVDVYSIEQSPSRLLEMIGNLHYVGITFVPWHLNKLKFFKD